MRVVFNKSQDNERPLLAELHTPPASFQRGKPVSVVARVPKISHLATIAGLRLRYRHVNQAEAWRSVELERAGKDYRAAIPADYTDSPFALQYYVQIRTDSGNVWLYPGLEQRWHGQPYFFIQPA